MARRRSSSDSWEESLAKFIFFVLFASYSAIAAFWNSLTPTLQIGFVVLIVVTLASGIGSLILFSKHRSKQRTQAWEKAMTEWGNAGNKSAVNGQQSAKYLSDSELEKFAAQVYSKMGYRVTHTGRMGDHGVDVNLVDPQNRIEVVQCKQWRKQVGEPQIRDLYGAMQHERAVKGWLWAPGGFSYPAKRWAKGKPIELIDDEEIGKLIGIAYRDESEEAKKARQ